MGLVWLGFTNGHIEFTQSVPFPVVFTTFIVRSPNVVVQRVKKMQFCYLFHGCISVFSWKQ